MFGGTLLGFPETIEGLMLRSSSSKGAFYLDCLLGSYFREKELSGKQTVCLKKVNECYASITYQYSKKWMASWSKSGMDKDRQLVIILQMVLWTYFSIL